MIHATLTILVVYDNNAVADHQVIKRQLYTAANFLANKGMLSDDQGQLLVEGWTADVEIKQN